MSNCYFVTGFPGFIATNLISALANRSTDARFLLLTERSESKKAENLIAVLKQQNSRNSFTLIQGDITESRLGLAKEDYDRLQGQVSHLLHLASVCDLTVRDNISHKVNVLGTDNVNKFAKSIKTLQRYLYFSTANVSGKRTGRILETDLDHNQSFGNYYELSKFRAEKLVQEVARGIPTTVIRPAIVIGNSKTGETSKFDGPYFFLSFFSRFSMLPLAYLGKSKSTLNLVPVDYVVDATAHLLHTESAAGQTYHLADPFPYTIHQIYERLHEEMLGRKPSWTLPFFLVSASLRIPFWRRTVGLPRELVKHFDYHATYDTTQARSELSKAGITCPDFFSYLPVILDYYNKHKADPDKIRTVR